MTSGRREARKRSTIDLSGRGKDKIVACFDLKDAPRLGSARHRHLAVGIAGAEK
jgi:hypothetical protein